MICWCYYVQKKRGVYFTMLPEEIVAEKCGTVTVSVYKDKNNESYFLVQSDSDEVVNVVEIIEDTLHLY